MRPACDPEGIQRQKGYKQERPLSLVGGDEADLRALWMLYFVRLERINFWSQRSILFDY